MEITVDKLNDIELKEVMGRKGMRVLKYDFSHLKERGDRMTVFREGFGRREFAGLRNTVSYHARKKGLILTTVLDSEKSTLHIICLGPANPLQSPR